MCNKKAIKEDEKNKNTWNIWKTRNITEDVNSNIFNDYVKYEWTEHSN